MQLETVQVHGVTVAVLRSETVLITDVPSALDLIVSATYETGSERIVLSKAALCEEFFDLKTRIAGEILQKFVTYHVKVAIVGDFSAYTSKSLTDFIRESNQGKHIFFLNEEEQAIETLATC